MKKLFVCLLLVAAPLQARAFNQAELDALLAPIALYPDVLLNQVLEASTHPGQLAQAANWSRTNTQYAGQDAVNAVQSWGWDPSVSALVAFPDVLQRMDANPQWLRDLGEAWRDAEPYVLETVQQLRQRAEAAGNLRNDGVQEVYRQGDSIVVQPVYPQYVVAPYYDPLVVFGTWWWTTYRPVVWRPWIARPVFWPWHRNRHDVHVVVRPAVHRVIQVNGAPSPAAQFQRMQTAAYLDRQRALAQPSPAARFQIAQAQQARPQAQVRPVQYVQYVPRPAAPAIQQRVAASVVTHAAPAYHGGGGGGRAAPSGGRGGGRR